MPTGHEARPDQIHVDFTEWDLEQTLDTFIKDLKDIHYLNSMNIKVPFNPEVIVTIKNGGIVAAKALGEKLNLDVLYFNRDVIPEFEDIKHKHILLVDDILDSGLTIEKAVLTLLENTCVEKILVMTLNFKYAAKVVEDMRVLYYQTNPVAHGIFIDYFWEKEKYDDGK